MVKVVEATLSHQLENQINECIKDQYSEYKLKDIKFSTTQRKTGSYSDLYYTAILIFE